MLRWRSGAPQDRTICATQWARVEAQRGAEHVSREREQEQQRRAASAAEAAPEAPDVRALHAAELIQTGGARAFYGSYLWRAASAEARRRQRNECQDCRARGLYAPAEQVHHVRPLLRSPLLAIDQSNLVCLCEECHERRHGRGTDGAELPPER